MAVATLLWGDGNTDTVSSPGVALTTHSAAGCETTSTPSAGSAISILRRCAQLFERGHFQCTRRAFGLIGIATTSTALGAYLIGDVINR